MQMIMMISNYTRDDGADDDDRDGVTDNDSDGR